MKYTFTIPNKKKSTVVADISFFTGQHKLYVDGEQIEHTDKYRKEYEVPHSRTTTKKLKLVPKGIDFGLTAYYGDKMIPVAPKLPILDYVFGFLPFGIGVYASAVFDSTFIGSFVIGILSIMLSFLNIKIFRNQNYGYFRRNLFNIIVCFASYGVFYLVHYIETLIIK